MDPRTVLKQLRGFAERELKEKRAEQVMVRRVKPAQLLRRGRIPDSRVRGVEGARYLVSVLRDKGTRVYFFDAGGTLLGAEEFMDKELDNMSAGSKIVFRLR